MTVSAKALTGAIERLTSGPIARSSIASLAIRLIGLALTFVTSIIAARLLGVTNFGVAAVTLSAAQVGATFALLGYNIFATREVARRLSSGQTALLKPFVRHSVTAVSLAALAAAALMALPVLIEVPIVGQYRVVFWIGALAIPSLALIQLFRGVTQGFGAVANAQWPGELLRPALLAALLVPIALTGMDLTPETYLAIIAAISLFATLIAGKIVLQLLDKAPVQVATPIAQPNWRRDAMPFFGLALIAAMQAEFATIMLGAFASAEQAGLFQPIARLTPLMALPVQAAAMRTAPRIAELWESDEMERLRSIIRTFTLTTTGLSALISLALAGAGPWILAAFGPDFTASANLLWIIAIAQIFNAACGPVGYLLMMTGNGRVAMFGQVAGLAVSLILAALLLTEYGALGAAIAVAGGIVSGNAFMLVAVWRIIGFDPSILNLQHSKFAL